MADTDDKDSKTELATEKKIRDALEKGNTPVAREVATFSSLVGLMLATTIFLVPGVRDLSQSLRRLIDEPGGIPLNNAGDVVAVLRSISFDVGVFILPIAAFLMVAGVAGPVLQVAPRLSFDKIKPDVSRLSLVKGWQRIFGRRGQVEFLKSVFKFAAVGTIGFLLIQSAKFDVFAAVFVDPHGLPELVFVVIMQLISSVMLAALVLAVADVAASRVLWLNDLRMTRHEVKEEIKQSDGDPIVRARLRSLAQDRARNRMIAAVPRATLVVANPTHFAVALRYVREEGGAPLVVAKGKDLIALRIRQEAEENAIPVVEDKALARSLFHAVEVEQMIPPEFYQAIAEIVTFVMAKSNQAAAR